MRKLTRIDGIDALRGLAIFFVVMNHVNMRLRSAEVPYTNGLPEQLVSSLVWNGQLGVQIFFAVSGFLITSTALRRWRSLSRLSVRDFYALRFARIAPLLVLLLTILSVLHLVGLKYFVVSPEVGGLGRALFAAVTFHVNVLEASRGYLPANWDILWSLSVEEMFYLFFPVACRVFKSSKLFVVVLVIFVGLGPFGRTVLAHGNGVWKEYSYLGSMDAIALGCLTALLVSRVRFSRPALRTFALFGAALMGFILMFSIRASQWGLDSNGLNMTILAIGTCMIMIVAAQTQWTASHVIRPLLTMGEHSYEIYLTHMFVVFAFFELFLQAGKPMLAVPLFFIATLVTSALAGKVTARNFSEPMNNRLRKLFGRESHRLVSVMSDPPEFDLRTTQKTNLTE
jgi:peptidoglycan/LPS O-acetylase OafA/YrhL